MFCLSFAWAFDSLRADLGDPQVAKDAAKKALAVARQAVEKNAFIPTGFLRQPTTLPIYAVVRDAFVSQRASFRPHGGEEAAVLKARLDSAFTRAVFEVWSKDTGRFAPLETALKAPGASANAFEREWDAYRQRLIWEFTIKPVFGQEETKVSLSQLYVPLRGLWWDKGHGPRGQGMDPDKPPHVVRLDEMLDQWIASGDADDWLRLIGGGPGSGKSTTLKALARRLANRPNFRPLYIPLQHIDLGGDLREAINHHFTDTTDCPFRHPPLGREAIETGPPLVLLFDGLDELARPHGGGETDVTVQFSTKLQALATALRGDQGRILRVVVSGRPVAFQTARRHLPAGANKSYEVAGLLPLPDDWQGDTALIATDLRPVWWEQYAVVNGLDRQPPPAMTEQGLMELTAEPLLCYLLALSGYVTGNWQEAADNHNRIYEKLIEEVWRRGWGDGSGRVRRQGPGRELTHDDFVRLMETIALAAWHGGDTRVATEERFDAAMKILRTTAIWQAFKKINGPDVGNLALNFYLKSHEADRRGYEFTHKSFGDYLTARAISRIAGELVRQIDWRIETAAAEWLTACGDGVLTFEILKFLRGEARLAAIGNCVAIKDAFVRLASHALADGFPAHQAATTWRGAEQRQNRAEALCWAVMNASAWALHGGGAPVTLQVSGLEGDTFAAMTARVSGGGPFGQRRFAFLSLEGLKFQMLNLGFADLSFAVMTGVGLSGSSFAFADMTGAILTSASFVNVDFYAVTLRQTDLRGAYLDASDLGHSVWIDVAVSGLTLSERTAAAMALPDDVFEPGTLRFLPGRVSNDNSDGKFIFTPEDEG
ncbi:NACHT domain-containing NTPase [Magnetospirillum sp. LM-5]|uniref:NACHT domain-containing protein n=1 Tax=Magnetospirillum sp. LM-5 TaxID=2681466 RepID=UPI00156D727E|nr:pentapeptide repeat-containing protein [Magnetospirillum sp. LM-5]